MKNFSVILSTVAIIIASVAMISTSKNRSGSLEDQVVEVINSNPKLVADALQAYSAQKEEEQRKAAEAALQKYAPEINNDAHAPSVGPKDAKVTVVEFFDFSCGYCKRLAPTIEETIAKNADVKFVFKPLSFVAPVSAYEARAAFAANKQGKFVEFYTKVMGAQGRMDEAAVDKIAEGLGLNIDQYKKDIQSEEINSALKEIAGLAQEIQVNGVPTLFINGKQVYARDVNELQNAINSAK